MTHQWTEAEFCSPIVNLAHKTIEDNPRSRFVCLGNSPAPIIEAIHCEGMHCGIGIETRRVPFSEASSFFTRPIIVGEDGIYYFHKLCGPSADQASSFERLLKEKELDPQTIIKRYTHRGIKTVVVDCANTGRGAASFLYLLLSWAEREKCNAMLEQSVCAYLYTERLFQQEKRSVHYNINNMGQIPVVLRCGGWSLMAALANCADENRLLPHCPPEKWDSGLSALEKRHQIEPCAIEGLNRVKAAVRLACPPRQPAVSATDNIMLAWPVLRRVLLSRKKPGRFIARTLLTTYKKVFHIS